MSRVKTYSLTEGSIAKGMVYFAIPIFFGQLFQQMYNMADSLIVGNFLGSEALAAVTSTGSLTFLLVGFFNGTAMGAGVVIARYFGARDYKNVKTAIHTNVAFAIVCGVLMTLSGVIFSPHILKLMGTPADVFPQSVAYLRVYFLGSLATVMYNVCMGILQAVGDSKRPLYYLIVSSITNVVLDVIFCGVFRLGVGYAALATVISQFVSVILCLGHLIKTDDVYKVNVKDIGMDKAMLKQIIRIGLPMGLQNSIISLANVVVQSNINAFGKMAMAGSGAHARVEGFAFLPVTCFTNAITTFVSQNIGAKQYQRVKKGAAFGVICAMILAEVVGVIIYNFSPFFISLFDTNPEVVHFGTMQGRIMTLFYFLMAFSHAAASIMRGAGRSAVPMYVMLVAWCVIRVTYITITIKFIPDIRVVFWAYPLTWTISSVIFLIYLWKVDWVHGFEKQEA